MGRLVLYFRVNKLDDLFFTQTHIKYLKIWQRLQPQR